MNSLTQKLEARIRSRGAITFRDFMESALYDSDAGYYNTERPKIGPAGDYYTSSNVHAAFGASLARLFAGLLEQSAGESIPRPGAVDPAPVDANTILEVGAGTGQLPCDILRTLRIEHPQIYSRVKYLIAERSPAMERRQSEKLGDFVERVQWAPVTDDGRPEVREINGIIFSNELIDAIPVHVVRTGSHDLEELYVTCDDKPGSISEDDSRRSSPPSGKFRFSWGTVSSERIRQYLERMGVPLSVGQTVEVNLDVVDWLQAVGRILMSGYLVTVDYGDVAHHLYGQDRRRGTLRAFHKHTLAASVLDRVGEQDITSSVNFTALIEYGRDAGLETVSFERQSAFLVRMGLIERIAQMEARGNVLADLKDRLAIKNLFVPGGASDNFRVLIQRKIVEPDSSRKRGDP